MIVSSLYETSIGLAASLALAGVLPTLDYACGLGTLSLLDGDLTASPFKVKDGYLDVPRTAPAPDPVLLEKYAADPERTAWWRDRVRRTAHHVQTTVE